MKLCDYKDHEIEVSAAGYFSANGIESYFETLEKLQSKIDSETKIKYKPADGFIFGDGRWSSSNVITDVKVTRPHGNPNRKEFWISDANKKRSTTCNVYLDTPRNREIAAKIIENNAAVKALSAASDRLYKALDSNFVLEQV